MRAWVLSDLHCDHGTVPPPVPPEADIALIAGDEWLLDSGDLDMKTLQIDDKWSVEYDPRNNDRPVRLLRYGEPSATGPEEWNNLVTAIFYALLEARQRS